MHKGFHDEDEGNTKDRTILDHEEQRCSLARLRKKKQRSSRREILIRLDMRGKGSGNNNKTTTPTPTTTTLQTPDVSDSNTMLTLGRLEIAHIEFDHQLPCPDLNQDPQAIS